MQRRVVVTGLGLITPLGVNVETTWLNLIKGKSGIKKIDRLDLEKIPSKIAGLVDQNPDTGFNPLKYLTERDLKKMDLFIQYGICAAEEAIEDSKINFDSLNKERVGVMMGSGIGGVITIEKTISEFYLYKKKVSPYFVPSTLINLLSGNISIRYGLTGPNHSVVTACATGTHSIGDAMRLIKFNDADVMIAGGSEAPIATTPILGFSACKALSTHFNDAPQKASRPWDQDRDGFIMAEGSGVVLLEEYEHAKKRGAKIYAEILGYGLSGDGYHITSPNPDASGGIQTMTKALKSANLTPNQIDYINAHSASTPIGDKVELDAVQKLFLYENPKLLMSSTKSSTGHLLGAAGSVEVIFCILALNHSIVPPTLNLNKQIEGTKINLVSKVAQEKKIKYALSNSFGFGGTNASIIVSSLNES